MRNVRVGFGKMIISGGNSSNEQRSLPMLGHLVLGRWSWNFGILLLALASRIIIKYILFYDYVFIEIVKYIIIFYFWIIYQINCWTILLHKSVLIILVYLKIILEAGSRIYINKIKLTSLFLIVIQKINKLISYILDFIKGFP